MMDELAEAGETALIPIEIDANIGDLFSCESFQKLIDELDKKPDTKFMITPANTDETRKISSELLGSPKNYGEMKEAILKVAMQRKINTNADQRAIKNLLSANKIPSFTSERHNDEKKDFREKVATLIMNLSVGEIEVLVKKHSSLFGRNEF